MCTTARKRCLLDALSWAIGSNGPQWPASVGRRVDAPRMARARAGISYRALYLFRTRNARKAPAGCTFLRMPMAHCGRPSSVRFPLSACRSSAFSGLASAKGVFLRVCSHATGRPKPTALSTFVPPARARKSHSHAPTRTPALLIPASFPCSLSTTFFQPLATPNPPCICLVSAMPPRQSSALLPSQSYTYTPFPVRSSRFRAMHTHST